MPSFSALRLAKVQDVTQDDAEDALEKNMKDTHEGRFDRTKNFERRIEKEGGW